VNKKQLDYYLEIMANFIENKYIYCETSSKKGVVLSFN